MRKKIFWIYSVLFLVSSGCEKTPADHYQGYIEADYLYLSSLTGGTILTLPVRRGDKVDKGQLIAHLDDTAALTKKAQLEAERDRAKSDLIDLQKGERPEELAIMRAQIEQAKARIRLSEPRVERRRQLVKNNIVGQESVDEAEAAIEEDRHKIAEMEARLKVAEMPARPDQITAAASALAAKEAQLAEAVWQLDHYTVIAPEAGTIEDIYFRIGEIAGPNAPIAQLLPPTRLKVRFYIPELVLGKIALGQKVFLSCDGCAQNLTASIRFIAQQAEYTPPVIYSRESRSKLVFLVEAYPEDPSGSWHPGQPVDVRLAVP